MPINNQKGFTIIESLVAFMILTTAVIPALYVSRLANSISASIRNNMAASGLAQEGVEIVRALRDQHWNNGLPFDQGLAGSWRVQYNSNSLIAIADNPPLKISNGLYNYNSGTDTIFKRTLTIAKINGAVQIISDVTWTERERSKDVRVESYLYDWK